MYAYIFSVVIGLSFKRFSCYRIGIVGTEYLAVDPSGIKHL